MWLWLPFLVLFMVFFGTVATVCWLVEREHRRKKRAEAEFRSDVLEAMHKKDRK